MPAEEHYGHCRIVLSVFLTPVERGSTQIIPNTSNLVSSQAGFISLLLIRWQRQMRAHNREKAASISCHFSCCVSKVHSINASLTGAFLFLLCSRSNTLYTQLKRVSCFSLNAFWLKVYLFLWAKDYIDFTSYHLL